MNSENNFFSSLAQLLVTHAREARDDTELELQPPATIEEILAFEKKIGVKFPEQLKLTYSLVGDGEHRKNSTGVLGGDSWASLGDILCNYDFHDQDDPFGNQPDVWESVNEVKQGQVWRKEWIPIGSGYDNRFIYIDTDPSDEGKVGQVLFAQHVDYSFGVLAPSIKEFWELVLSRSDYSRNWNGPGS